VTSESQKVLSEYFLFQLKKNIFKCRYNVKRTKLFQFFWRGAIRINIVDQKVTVLKVNDNLKSFAEKNFSSGAKP